MTRKRSERFYNEIHLRPEGDADFMPCCGKKFSEASPHQRISKRERFVTCGRESEPCNMYGCRIRKPKGAVFCALCYEEYLDDPEAFK